MTPVIALLFSLLIAWIIVLTFLLVRVLSKALPEKNIISSTGFRLGLVKFSPFSDTGGDQSFVISLLDGGGNGILITSLHARGVTRLYAKKVTSGKTEHSLSLEEKEALKQSLDL